MRLSDPLTSHTLALYALPTLVAWLGWGVPAALVATLVVAAAAVALRARALFTPGDAARVELHTITYSHYVEKVRWCLDRTDITFASLAALALFPDGYGGDAVSVRSAPLDDLAPAWRAEVESLRATTAGQFVLRLYREERQRR